MGKLSARTKMLLIIIGALVGIALVYVLLQSCEAEGPHSEAGLCTNEIDDDEDGATDCEDIDCYLDNPVCQESVPVVPAPVAQIDGDVDADIDADVDTDDADIDDSDPDDGPQPDTAGICDPDSGACDWTCRYDSDCRLVYDLWECCGGFPHTIEGEMVSCVSASHVDRVRIDRCVLPWSGGGPPPNVPSGCRPTCTGVSCPRCPEADSRMRAVCRSGRCRALCSDCCSNDSDCRDGLFCVDPTNEGQPRCRRGAHECNDGDECLEISAYSMCRGCNCGDVTHDGFRDCACYGCEDGGAGPPPGTCNTDRDCPPRQFCEDRVCAPAAANGCREAMGDCGPCAFCQRDPDQPAHLMRGICVPMDWGQGGPPPGSGCE